MIEARELEEDEAVTTMETIGDTPVWGVFEDGQLIAVTPSYTGRLAERIAKALR